MKKTDYKDKVKKYYAKHAPTYSESIASWRLELIQKYNKENKVALDLGCGTGNYFLPLKNKQKYALDLSKESIAVLKKRIKNKEKKEYHVYVGDAIKMPFKDNTFDFLFSFSTLYYIKEIDLIMPEISRVLKKEGIAILEFGNKYSIESVWDKMMFDCPQFHFSSKKIKKLFEENHLKIVEQKYRRPIPDFMQKFDKAYIKNKFLQKISFKMIFVVRKK
jgi:ubiquinone/menaquinone biosynthesis C-methylase UbiE